MGFLIISHIRAIDIDRSMVTPSTGYVHKTTVSIRVVDVWLSTCDKKVLILEGEIHEIHIKIHFEDWESC